MVNGAIAVIRRVEKARGDIRQPEHVIHLAHHQQRPPSELS